MSLKCTSISNIEPIIGWIPLLEDLIENSNAPNKLPLSVNAKAGILLSFAKFTKSSILIAPWANE